MEFSDDRAGVVLRRIVVGSLRTNCWAVHAMGDTHALLVDPGDEPDRILDAVSDLQVSSIVLTHAHWDHVLAVPAIVDALGIPVLAHPADAAVWPHDTHLLTEWGHWDAGTATTELLTAGDALRPESGQKLWDGRVDQALHDGQQLRIGTLAVEALHTPGHTPGSVTLRIPGHLLTGDTLFPGGPGLTGARWELSDFSTIMRSVTRLLPPGADTAIHPGHGPSTTAAREHPHLREWRARGW